VSSAITHPPRLFSGVDEIPESIPGEPTWEMVEFYPRQGMWTEDAFLSLSTNRLIELTDGVLEFLEMPDRLHQWLQKKLLRMLDDFVTAQQSGEVLGAPLPIRLRPDQLREPDVVYFQSSRLSDDLHQVPNGADLVMEVVSPSPKSRKRDLATKRQEYGEAGVAEYWVVDPETETITVLTLPAGAGEYAVHGVFQPGQQATSVLLPGFSVEVAACFAAGKGEPT